MPELPLVREIRAARQRLASVSGATDLLRRVDAARMALGILERQQVAHADRTYAELPGSDVFAAVAERFTELADLTTPARTTPDRALSERRRALDALSSALKPIADDERAASSELHELRHDQHHQLKQPQYAEAMAALAAITAERDAVHSELNPRVGRLGAVAPSKTLLAHTRQELAWVHEPIAGNPAVAAYRALAVACGLLDVLRRVLLDTGFDLPVPDVIELPDGPDADAAESQLAWVRTQLREVAELEAALSGQSEALQAEIDALQDSLRHHNQRIEEMLG